ncbi:MAG TPA: calcium/proton exchanger [Actinomycetes bacterium]|nr:calcium/proton exchanger [Actinomycetes bacterium]
MGAAGLGRGDVRLIVAAAVAAVLSGITHAVSSGDVAPFAVSAVALALLAALVGRAVDALGDSLGPGATGVLQSGLGNLPELFVCLFSLHAGLYAVVQGTIVGSILSNVLLVLGLCFIVGGVRHGTQTFAADRARTTALLLVLSVMALLVPSLTAALHTPASGHEKALSVVVALSLLVLFALSLPGTLARENAAAETAEGERPARWPLAVAVGVLALTGLAAALVSDWFVDGLTPAINALGISQTFAGLVIVAIAGNAVENVVGIQLAARNHTDYALSIVLQSPLQIALVLAPVLVLVAPLVGASFTLVLSPLLIAVLAMAVLVTMLVVLDGESTWLEGSMLVALYCLIATAFWWG